MIVPEFARISTGDIARIISQLPSLRIVSLHLDLPATPGRTEDTRQLALYYNDQDLITFESRLSEVANEIALLLGESVEHFRLPVPTNSGSEWVLYRICRDDHAHSPVTAELYGKENEDHVLDE